MSTGRFGDQSNRQPEESSGNSGIGGNALRMLGSPRRIFVFPLKRTQSTILHLRKSFPITDPVQLQHPSAPIKSATCRRPLLRAIFPLSFSFPRGHFCFLVNLSYIFLPEHVSLADCNGRGALLRHRATTERK